MKILKRIAGIILISVSAIIFGSLATAEKNTAHDWTTNNPNETSTVDHSYWGAILEKIVIEGSLKNSRRFRSEPKTTSKLKPSSQSSPLKKGINLISYDLVSKSIGARKAVSDYIKYLETFKPTALSRDEQIAFWLNLHNSVFVRTVLNEYPIRNMQKLGIEKRETAEFYQTKRVNIEDQSLSLYEIEQITILIGGGDLMVPYGLVYGSHSTPNILNYSFTGEKVHAQLKRAAGKFINSFGTKTSRKSINYSPFYNFFSDIYFSNGDEGLRRHLQSLASEKKIKRWTKKTGIKSFSMSKKLNELPSRTMATMGISSGVGMDGSINLPIFAAYESLGSDVGGLPGT
ncbi:MAG: DUF547 domain-containing protein [Sphingomonadales bacterium]